VFTLRNSRRRLLLVTSAVPGEGKTTTATHLGALLAQGGRRVLLVDADLRKAELHRTFGLPRSPGLSDVLTGAVEDPIRATPLPKLSLVSAGRTPADPAELFGSDQMDAFLARVEGAFDFVIVDAPPVLGLADSVALASKVDAVLLLVSAEGPRRGAVSEAVRRLRFVHAPLIGTILNMADARTCAYGYGYYGYPRGGSMTTRAWRRADRESEVVTG
jgi:capsular exopolysaccharide synthesis family protein